MTQLQKLSPIISDPGAAGPRVPGVLCTEREAGRRGGGEGTLGGCVLGPPHCPAPKSMWAHFQRARFAGFTAVATQCHMLALPLSRRFPLAPHLTRGTIGQLAEPVRPRNVSSAFTLGTKKCK